MKEWNSFVRVADEWLIAYASVPSISINVALFCAGHTLELYLKATYAKLTGKIEEAIKFSHNLEKLWDECRKIDQSFLSDYNIQKNILRTDFVNPKTRNQLGKDDLLNYLKFQELYLVLKHLPDIKYGSAPWKSNSKESKAYATTHPNDFWIRLLGEIRKYLSYPPNGRGDFIKWAMESEPLSPQVLNYLKKLYE